MDEKILIYLHTRGTDSPIPEPIAPDALRAEVEKKMFSETMNAKLFSLAEDIIKNHMRFGDAEPPSDVVARIFDDVSACEGKSRK
jgi:hypothetical protein